MHGKEEPFVTGVAPAYSIRSLLLVLVLACLLPGIVGAAMLVLHAYQDGRAQLQKATLQTARALVQTVDSRLLEAQRAAQTLSTSGYLATRDFAAFHRQARQTLQKIGIDGYVVLADKSGRHLVNTSLPFGANLPLQRNLAQLDYVFTTAQTHISDVYIASATQRPMVSIDVPVLFGDKVIYDLGIVIAPEYFHRILLSQNLPSEWSAAILDRNGTIAARTRDPRRFAGQHGALLLVQQAPRKAEGTLESRASDGQPVLNMFSRSPSSNWSVVIGIPRQLLEAQLTHTVALLALCAIVLFALSTSLAWFMGERIARSVRALSDAAFALGLGTHLKPAKVHFREAAEVGMALGKAAQLLHERAAALQQAHRALQEREAELTNAQRIAHVGSWSWDVVNDSHTSSQELCAVFGCRILPPFAQQCGTLYSRQTWQILNAALQTALATGVGYDLELPARHGSGRPMWIHTRCEAVANGAGKVVGLRGTIQDITERRQAEQALLQSRAQLRKLMEHQEAAREEARKRIARDLHDELGQNLMGLRIDVSLMAGQRNMPEVVKPWCDGMLSQIDTILKSVRAIMNDLRPAVLNLGLHAATEWQVKQFERRTGIPCHLKIDHPEFAMSDKCATALFRIIQESLTNIWRHAKARQASITMRRVDNRLFVEIVDDGIGLPVDGSKAQSGFGLCGIQERISALGGSCSIKNQAAGGLAVVVSIPIRLADRAEPLPGAGGRGYRMLPRAEPLRLLRTH